MLTSVRTPLADASRRLGYGALRARFGLLRAANGFRLKPAERLLIAPQELETGDPSVAIAFYSGQIILAGRSVQIRGLSPFAVDPPNAAWVHELHGFSWLRHFRDADNPVVRHFARALIADWLKQRELRTDPVAQSPAVTGRRMLSWLSNAPLLLSDVDHDTYHRFMRSLARDAQWLEFCARRRTQNIARLTAAIAFSSYTLCALTPDNDWKRASSVLADALKDTIMADGVPISRNPADALQIAIDCLQLRTAYTARGRTPPAELQASLDRLMCFLRLIRHGDGALALFNGMGATPLILLGAVLAFDAADQTALDAPQGGYSRLNKGDASLIVDHGRLPPANASANAHASAASFEFSSGRERIVVSCGASPPGMGELREALRETAAHSALIIDADSSARFYTVRLPDGTVSRLMAETGVGKSERTPDTGGETITIAHDGYMRAFGIRQTRALTLTEDGEQLIGLDSLEAKRTEIRTVPVCLRFHIHPRAQISLLAGATGARIDLGDGSIWTFAASGMPVRLEESIFLGGLASQRRAVQIVVEMPEGAQTLQWSFMRRTPASD